MRPIANKYREGKMKTTLNREFKGGEPVLAEGEWLSHPSCNTDQGVVGGASNT